MSISQSLPPGDKSLVPSQTKTFTIEEKHYIPYPQTSMILENI